MTFKEVKTAPRNPYPRPAKDESLLLRISNLGACGITRSIIDHDNTFVDSVLFELDDETGFIRFKLGVGYKRPLVGRVFNIPPDLSKKIMMTYVETSWTFGKSFYFKMQKKEDGYWYVIAAFRNKPK